MLKSFIIFGNSCLNALRSNIGPSNSWKRAIIPSTLSVELALGFSGGKPPASLSDHLTSLLSTTSQQAHNMNLAHKNVSFLGIGGRTISKMLSFDLDTIKAFQPKAITLELGTNDLCVVG